jgi:cob(I)alamin adenosyltransferase
MGSRLSKITTRTGDAGETGLGDGRRVAKDSARVTALGDVDELNSALGVLLASGVPADVEGLLIEIQHDLFDLGGELSIPGHTLLTEGHVARLEAAIERFNAPLAPLKEFILPGGVPAAAHAHLARAICRRAERSVVATGREDTVSTTARVYLNRLSDLLFILARHINRKAGTGDVLWSRARP